VLETGNDGGASPTPVFPPGKPSAWESVFLGPQGIRTGWRIALFIALFIFFFATLQFAGTLLHLPVPHLGQITPDQLLIQEIMMCIAVVAATIAMSRIEARPFGDYGMPLRGALRGRFWQGAAWGLAQITLLILLIAALGGYSFGGLALRGAGVLRYALLWAAAFFLVAVFEEFVFRGYLQFTLASAIHFWPAAALTSLGFGAVHLANPGERPVGAVSVFVVGMFLCLTLRRTGNLWFAIGWHTAFNFGQTYLYAVPNSGIVMQGQLLGASLDGPAWLTGGTVGPEGSALSFVVVALAFVIFSRVYRQHSPS